MSDSYFKPSELRSSYSEFKKISDYKKPDLRKEVLEWLYAWELYDLALSPMDDDERKILRYGHFEGWFAHKYKHS